MSIAFQLLLFPVLVWLYVAPLWAPITKDEEASSALPTPPLEKCEARSTPTLPPQKSHPATTAIDKGVDDLLTEVLNKLNLLDNTLNTQEDQVAPQKNIPKRDSSPLKRKAPSAHKPPPKTHKGNPLKTTINAQEPEGSSTCTQK